MKKYLAFCLLLLAALSAGCIEEDCDREGCDAVEKPAAGYTISTGIAGAVASQSDVVANGCCECPLSTGEILVFEAPEVFTASDEIEAYLEQNQEHTTVSVSDEYEHALSEGMYLVCAYDSGGLDAQCASVDIRQGDVFTVHVVYVFGPTSLRLFEPGQDEASTTGIYDVSLPWLADQ